MSPIKFVFAFIIGLSLTVSLSSAQSNYYIVPTDKIIETAFSRLTFGTQPNPSIDPNVDPTGYFGGREGQ